MATLTPPPALAPPPGITPKFVNPPSQAIMVVISCAICLSLIMPIASLRFYTNIWIKSSFNKEDWACAFATAGSIAYTAVVLSTIHITGRHQWDVPVTDELNRYAQKLFIVVDMMYVVVGFSAKLSLLLLYYRLFALHQWMRYLIYLGVGLSFALCVASLGVFGYLCLPHRGEGWLQAALSARCHQQFFLIAYVRGPLNLLSDLYLLLLPLPAVWELHVPLQKKLGISGIFLTGSLACIASAVGLYYRVQLFKSADLIWNLAPMLTTLVIELNVGTICACLPYLATFYRHHRLKSHQLDAIKTFTSRISPFTSSKKKTVDHRLGTHILGSAQGEGKFLTSDDFSDGATFTTVTTTSDKWQSIPRSSIDVKDQEIDTRLSA